MDDKTNQGQPDRSKINVNEPYELQYWSQKFGVSHTELRLAVQKVGTNPVAVQEALKKGGDIMTQSAQRDLKDSKEVMEDEGGANQASLKKQQVEKAEKPDDTRSKSKKT